MPDELRIVGIGASAGGVEALKGFFENMPPDSGMAFVIILHLSAGRTSMLSQVIGRWTEMKVEQARNGAKVLANRIYVIPPDFTLGMSKGLLQLTKRPPHSHEPTQIDDFFASLAADKGAGAVGIVLSGTGSDGALGLKAIKNAGGVTLAQGDNASSPQYHDMPAAAIASGAVDLVVPVEAMPERIISLRVPPPEAPADHEPDIEQIAAAKLSICAILRTQVGHDFSGYKSATFMRRVHRRMQFLGLDVDDYVARLGADHGEVALLFRDLLIGITGFFRDREIYQVVEETVIPMLFKGKGADSTVRIWVPGCSTGEEAYSLAILLREQMNRLQAPPKAQIFATDIDEVAIRAARAGRYPAALMNGVSPERRQRFFTTSNGSYVISKEIRELCTFSAHSLIRDPPFLHTDMVSCRNLLIYLDTELQAKIIPAFHYSLSRGGILLLGGSEAVSRHADLFTPIDKKSRIFRRNDIASPPLQAPTRTLASRGVLLPGAREAGGPRSKAAAYATQRILDRFAPAFVVVNSAFDALHFSNHTGRYLEPAAGMPSSNIVAMARRGLKADLRAALRQSIESGQPAERQRIDVEFEGQVQPIAVTVEPMPADGSERLFLVVFSEAQAGRRQQEVTGQSVDVPQPDDANEQLERDLRDAREQAQSTAEEYETALEELKSANEELHSINEELQSTNEELETSKEEIQSMNEELHTVNAQLISKIEELDRNNSDLRNLFDSTKVATIFLDRFLILRGFTPGIAGIYNLIPSDHGRPLSDIASQLAYSDLKRDVRHVLETLEPFERRVTRLDGKAHYLMRVLPYRKADDEIDGAVITFVDVTSIVQAEQHQRLLVDELNHRVRNMLMVVVSLATQTLRGAASLEGFSAAFLGRLHGLAGTYALLTRESWQNIPLRSLLLEGLRSHAGNDGGNVDLDGAEIMLRPRVALALGMTLHELVTNAHRYGALSVPAGGVTVRWRLDEAPNTNRVVLTWQEHGGPAITSPVTRGFGSLLIERTLTHELAGKAEMNFAPDGLLVTLTFPLDATPSGRGLPHHL